MTDDWFFFIAYDSFEICIKLKECGLLAKPSHGIIRLSPPLCITEEQIMECSSIILNVFNSLKSN